MSEHYILRDREPVKCDLMTWANWVGGNDKIVRQDTLSDGVKVSTVFLGLNHQFGDGPPLLFETMIFGGDHDQYQERCTTWEQAEQMHAEAMRVAEGK